MIPVNTHKSRAFAQEVRNFYERGAPILQHTLKEIEEASGIAGILYFYPGVGNTEFEVMLHFGPHREALAVVSLGAKGISVYFPEDKLVGDIIPMYLKAVQDIYDVWDEDIRSLATWLGFAYDSRTHITSPEYTCEDDRLAAMYELDNWIRDLRGRTS